MTEGAQTRWAARSRYPLANMILCAAGTAVYLAYVNLTFQLGVGTTRRLDLRVPAAIVTVVLLAGTVMRWRQGPAPLVEPVGQLISWHALLRHASDATFGFSAIWLDVVRTSAAASRQPRGDGHLVESRCLTAVQCKSSSYPGSRFVVHS